MRKEIPFPPPLQTTQAGGKFLKLMQLGKFLTCPQPAWFEVSSENVIPFLAQKPAPILIRRWRTIVDVHGMRYALDVYRFLFAVGTGARRRGASATGSQCRGEASAPPSTQTLKLRFLPKMTAVVVSDRSA